MTVPVTIKTNKRAKKLSIRINSRTREVVLVKPRLVPMMFAKHFVKEQQGWIEAQLARLPEPQKLADGANVTMLGSEYTLRHIHERVKAKTVWIEGRELFVTGDKEHLERRVQDFLKRQAKILIAQKAEYYAKQLGVRYNRISLRDTTSRWGSCSAQGNLSFCWRLIMAPEQVLAYVVAHEVAHLKEMNHSAKFWQLVKQLHPSYEQDKAWLKTHGAALF